MFYGEFRFSETIKLAALIKNTPMFLSDFKTKYGISIYILIKSPPVSDFILTILLGATLIDADRQTDRQAGRQAGRQADRQTDRETDRHGERIGVSLL